MKATVTGLPEEIPDEVQLEIGRRICLEVNAFGYSVDGVRVVFEKDSNNEE